MFFKKFDVVSEEQIVAIGITAATVCFIVERQYPPKSVEGHLKYVNDSVDNITKSIKLNPNKETIEYIRMVVSSLVNDSSGFISGRVDRFMNGQKGVYQEEIQQALEICRRSVSDFLRSQA